jgi:hypothetical protein
MISAGYLTGAKARMLLRLLVAAGATSEDVGAGFGVLGTAGGGASLLGGSLVVT